MDFFIFVSLWAHLQRIMKYSIITINYNNRDGLRRTIESVVNQTFRDFEYIIIDGGSTDGSVEVIKEYANCIDYWVSEPDKGIYNAMNKGLKKCVGEWCLFLNSGDMLSEKSVLNDLKEDGSDNYGVIYTDWYDYSFNEKVLRKPYPFFERTTYLHHKGFCHQASLTRTTLAKKIRFDEKYQIAADYNMFYQLYKHGVKFKYIPIALSMFEIGIGLSQRKPRIAFKEDAKILHRYGTVRYFYHYFKRFIYPLIKIKK